MIEVTLEPTHRGKRIPDSDYDTIAWCPTVAAARRVTRALNKMLSPRPRRPVLFLLASSFLMVACGSSPTAPDPPPLAVPVVVPGQTPGRPYIAPPPCPGPNCQTVDLPPGVWP